ncbi:MAG: flagellin, partial [bacterium]
AEIDRIAETTQFNNQNVLDGSFSGAKFHVGANSYQTIQLKTTDGRANILGRQARYDGAEVSDEAFGDGDLEVNGIVIRATVDADDTLSTTLFSTSAIAKAAAINDSTVYTDVRAVVNKTVATGGAAVAAAAPVVLDSTNNIQINGELVTGFTVQQNDADHALTNAINAISDRTGVVATLDEDHQLVLTAEDGRNIDIVVAGNGANLGFAANQVSRGTLTLQSVEQITLEAADAAAAAALGLGGAGTTLLGVNSAFAVDTVDVTTREGANVAIEILDVALSQVSSIRSDLGAVQNRLESTISNLSTTAENITASRSRILDADFAEETAVLSRNQIIQQAGVSILAQANQSSQVALTLLG